jgi:hypothetical protein
LTTQLGPNQEDQVPKERGRTRRRSLKIEEFKKETRRGKLEKGGSGKDDMLQNKNQQMENGENR